MKSPKILIIGGGYGGLKVALGLERLVDFTASNPQITLINKHDYHYQTTLLHKVAVGTLSDRKARIYYRKLLDLNKVNFIKDKIISIDPHKRCVYGKDGAEYEYDILVVALGFKPENFGIEGVNEYAFKLSSLNSALKLARHIEHKFKDFAFSKDKNDLKFIVCGTGFTGIEFAAELASQIEELCCICGIDKSIPEVICIGRSEKILPVFSENLKDKASKKLENFGVKIINKADIIRVEKDGVLINKDNQTQKITANTILWGAGVKGNDVVENSAIANKKGRIEVDSKLRCKEFPEIFVVGDCASVSSKDVIHAPTAQLSAQMGDFVAKLLSHKIAGKAFGEDFVFKHRGTVCSIGHTDGVGVVYGKELSGEVAAFMKNLIENRWLFSLDGLKIVLKKGQFRFRSSN